MNKTKTVSVGGFLIKVTYKKMKYMRLRVLEPDASVMLSVPKKTNDKEIIEFLESNVDWIDKNKRRILGDGYESLTQGVVDHIYLLGKRYDFKHCKSDENRLFIAGENLVFCCNEMPKGEALLKTLTEFKRERFKSVLPGLIKECEQIAKINADEWRIRDMRTKWGTCNISDRRIWLRLDLVCFPVQCIKSVMLHELTHLYERRHTERFYGILRSFVENYDEVEKQLKSHDYI